jgi:hypothetical protein
MEKIWYNTSNGKQYKMNVLELVGKGECYEWETGKKKHGFNV